MRSIRRRSRAVAYVLSLLVIAAAAWMPTSIFAQVLPGSPFGSSGGGAGASAPFSDATALVKNASDATKLYKVDVSGVTTANTITKTLTGTAAAPVWTATAWTMRVGDLRLPSTGYVGWSSGADPTTAESGIARAGTNTMRTATGPAGASGGLWLTGRSVEANTGTKVPAGPESWEIYTNEGDVNGSIINLPTASSGLTYTAYVQINQTITINASSGDTIRIEASVSPAAGNISSATIGSAVTLLAINATEWVAISFTGTWAVST